MRLPFPSVPSRNNQTLQDFGRVKAALFYSRLLASIRGCSGVFPGNAWSLGLTGRIPWPFFFRPDSISAITKMTDTPSSRNKSKSAWLLPRSSRKSLVRCRMLVLFTVAILPRTKIIPDAPSGHLCVMTGRGTANRFRSHFKMRLFCCFVQEDLAQAGLI
jgi:hypothetical protein